MTGRSVLIIEDDPSLSRGLHDNFAAQHYRVQLARGGREGLSAALANPPDLLILDLMLPGMNGYEICRAIRARRLEMPIIMLSAKGQETDIVRGLELGADDYVTKPFSTLELKARVRALLRRASSHRAVTGTTIRHEGLSMDLEGLTLLRDGELVHLTPTEWELVRVLMTNAGKTMTHRQLFAAVWPGRQYGDAQQYLRVHVANVRRKIESNALDPRYIFTEPGVGYRFAAPQ